MMPDSVQGYLSERHHVATTLEPRLPLIGKNFSLATSSLYCNELCLTDKASARQFPRSGGSYSIWGMLALNTGASSGQGDIGYRSCPGLLWRCLGQLPVIPGDNNQYCYPAPLIAIITTAGNAQKSTHQVNWPGLLVLGNIGEVSARPGLFTGEVLG